VKTVHSPPGGQTLLLSATNITSLMHDNH
jgi:hypothetical protein